MDEPEASINRAARSLQGQRTPPHPPINPLPAPAAPSAASSTGPRDDTQPVGARVALLSGRLAQAEGPATRRSNGPLPKGARTAGLEHHPATRTPGQGGQQGAWTLCLSARPARRQAAWTPHPASRRATADRCAQPLAPPADDHPHPKDAATATPWPIRPQPKPPRSADGAPPPTPRHPKRSPPRGRPTQVGPRR